MNGIVRIYLPLEKHYISIPEEDSNKEDTAVSTQQKFIDQNILTWLVYT